MCGIAGFWVARRDWSADSLRAAAEIMCSAIRSRGPDSRGAYVNPALGLAIGHVRLAVLDLSPSGDQPMRSPCGRWVIAFNGEIYNYRDLRKNLETECHSILWRGTSDTEVLLHGLSHWGVRKTLQKINGMFAFIAIDQIERCIYLARDRVGEKPLYLGWNQGKFHFASELKALCALEAFDRRLDVQAVSQYLNYGYVPAPYSIYAGIRKLWPGGMATLKLDSAVGTEPLIESYWTLPKPCSISISMPDAVSECHALLRSAVELRMHADVPMGAFLSGGIDSSLVTALMQQHSSMPVKTYTIGFDRNEFDESKNAARVARHLGTDHHELMVTAQDSLALVDNMPWVFDEPFGDSSAIPTQLLAHMTRRSVTVALSGDGGDELFGGYARHFSLTSVFAATSRLPLRLRQAISNALTLLPIGIWDRLAARSKHPLLSNVNQRRVETLARSLASRTPNDFYHRLVRHWSSVELIPQVRPAGGTFLERFDLGTDFDDPVAGMCFLDTGSYLPDDILVKVDRALMSVSLEGRIPLLDHRVVEFAAGLPAFARVNARVGKTILRDILSCYLPREMFERPKQGFALPLEHWLRGPLKDWAQSLLNDRSLVTSDLLQMGPIENAWRQHLSQRSDQSARCWTILMLQAWAKRWRPTL